MQRRNSSEKRIEVTKGDIEYQGKIIYNGNIMLRLFVAVCVACFCTAQLSSKETFYVKEKNVLSPPYFNIAAGESYYYFSRILIRFLSPEFLSQIICSESRSHH